MMFLILFVLENLSSILFESSEIFGELSDYTDCQNDYVDSKISALFQKSLSEGSEELHPGLSSCWVEGMERPVRGWKRKPRVMIASQGRVRQVSLSSELLSLDPSPSSHSKFLNPWRILPD